MGTKIPNCIIFCTVLFLQCKEKPSVITYDNQNRLERIVNNIVKIDLQKPGSNSVVILLQNEDCICTEENMALSKDVITSNKYAAYQSIIITKGKKHKFLSILPAEIANKIRVYTDTSNYLFSHGYITTTDKIIVYQNGSARYFEDMHMTKPIEIRKKLL